MSSSKSADKAEEVKPIEAEEKVKAGVKTSDAQVKETKEVKPVQKKPDQADTKTAKKTQKKTAAKKTEKSELKPEVYIEYQGQQAPESAVIDKVKAAYVASGHRASSIKALQIYMKPEEFKAYYVINNGKYTGEVFLF